MWTFSNKKEKIIQKFEKSVCHFFENHFKIEHFFLEICFSKVLLSSSPKAPMEICSTGGARRLLARMVVVSVVLREVICCCFKASSLIVFRSCSPCLLYIYGIPLGPLWILDFEYLPANVRHVLLRKVDGICCVCVAYFTITYMILFGV